MCLHTFHTYIHTRIWSHTHIHIYTHVYTHTPTHRNIRESNKIGNLLKRSQRKMRRLSIVACTLVNCVTYLVSNNVFCAFMIISHSKVKLMYEVANCSFKSQRWDGLRTGHCT